MKKLIIISTVIALAGCAIPKREFPWQRYTLPIDNGEYITNVNLPDPEDSKIIALRAVYAACKGMRPVILEQNFSREGLMNEKAADAYNTAREAASMLGAWTPNLNDEKHLVQYRFRCDPV